MSEVRMAYPGADMTQLVYRQTLPGIPKSAAWWRLRLLPSPASPADGEIIARLTQRNVIGGKD